MKEYKNIHVICVSLWTIDAQKYGHDMRESTVIHFLIIKVLKTYEKNIIK